jgi:hypothetical protein
VKKLVTVTCFSLVWAATFLLPGCENDSDDSGLTITPNLVSLHNGDYADFTVSGGSNYTWSLQNPSWGTLSYVAGPTTRYTDNYDPGANANDFPIQVLTVSATTPGTSNAQGSVAIAQAAIEHLASGQPAPARNPTTTSTTTTTTSTTTTTTLPPIYVTISGSSFTVHHLWSDGSDYNDNGFVSPGQTYAKYTISKTPPGESHTLEIMSITWSGSTLTGLQVFIDGSSTALPVL